MTDTKIIETKINEGHLDQAIEMLDRAIESRPDDAYLWYLRGKVYWKMDKRGNAISDYEESAHLDPQSPAVQALELVRGIMDFYNTDLYNP